MTLTKRLQAIASKVSQHTHDLLDIGYDHGLLMNWALSHGIKHIGGVEVSEKFQDQYINRFGPSAIQFYTGSGFNPVRDRNYKTVVISGLGEERIREIIEGAEPAQLDACEHLIMCPSSTDLRLREYLNARGWLMTEEEIIEERGRYYVISHAVHGAESVTDHKWLKIGPRLFEGKDPLLEQYLDANKQLFKHRLNR